jgi:hypothetical protein
MAWQGAFGFDPGRFVLAVRGLPSAIGDYRRLCRQNRRSPYRWDIRFCLPCLHDRYEASGTATGHYFHQDLFVARRIYERRPVRHVDVGSRVDGFVAHVAVFRPIEVFDIRPLAARIPNVTFRRCDLMSLPPDLEACCDSLSCLHALEHFGLGRYGDPVDIRGHERGLDSLWRMLTPGGILYLSYRIGPDRIDFNGSRILSIRTTLAMTAGRFDLSAFSYLDDGDVLHEGVPLPLDPAAAASHFGQENACGIFEFRRKGPPA